jgi:transcriptional regulator with XRE-family HTH domain
MSVTFTLLCGVTVMGPISLMMDFHYSGNVRYHTRNTMSRDNSNIVEASAAQQLGKRIRELRTVQNLTLDTLADRSGVSRAMLSKIERGENNPTLVVVAKIAVALNLSLSQLVGVEERQQVVKVARSQQLVFRNPDTGFERHMIPALEGGTVELMRHIIPPRQSSDSLAAHPLPIEKYLVVEQGKVQVTLGDDVYSLEEGDVLYFRADVPHRYANPGDSICRYILVVLPPKTP